MSDTALPTVAVVMPAYNAAMHLPRSLGRLLELDGWDELVVVSPGSSDHTAELAREMGATVVDLGHRGGPAEARNAGVAVVDAEVVLFVDSDCVVVHDAIDRVKRAFVDPKLVSLTGSYDDDPPEQNLASLYMNLRHHHTHQHAKTEGATFWAGCGAVRRSVFLKVGGFDAELFPRPMIEDIELCKRMQRHGVTRMDHDLHATHLKRWTIGGVVYTDIFCRAIPWSRLILQEAKLPDDLNIRMNQRFAALISPFALLALISLPLAIQGGVPQVMFCVAVIAVSVVLNRSLLAFFARRKGLWFAMGGWLFHQVHLFYSAVTFVLCRVTQEGAGD